MGKINLAEKDETISIVSYLHSHGLNDTQMAEICNCKESWIRMLRRRLYLPKNDYFVFSKEENECMQEMYDLGWTDEKIVKRMHKEGFNISMKSIQYWRKTKRYAYANRHPPEYEKIISEDSLFCDTKFLEKFFGKTLDKKECT